MRIKCIDNTTLSGLFEESNLTKGKIYTVIKETNDCYTIFNDECLGIKSYSKKKFIKVEDNQ